MFLQTANRIEFNPEIKEHRIAAATFMKRNAWSDTNLRFTHKPEYDNIANQVRVRMLQWYMAQDLGKEMLETPVVSDAKKITMIID